MFNSILNVWKCAVGRVPFARIISAFLFQESLFSWLGTNLSDNTILSTLDVSCFIHFKQDWRMRLPLTCNFLLELCVRSGYFSFFSGALGWMHMRLKCATMLQVESRAICATQVSPVFRLASNLWNKDNCIHSMLICSICTDHVPPKALLELKYCLRKLHQKCLMKWVAERQSKNRVPTCPHCRALNTRFRWVQNKKVKEKKKCILLSYYKGCTLMLVD